MKRSITSAVAFSLFAVFAAGSAHAANFKESREYGEYLNELRQMSTSRLLAEKALQNAEIAAMCTSSAAAVAAVTAVNSLPLVGIAPKVAIKGVEKAVVELLDKSSLRFLLTADKAALNKHFKNVLVSQRGAEALSRWVADDIEGFRRYLVGLALGGVVTSVVDTAILLKDIVKGKSIDLDNLWQKHFLYTREAYRSTSDLNQLLFSESEGCRKHMTMLSATLKEQKMRTGQLARNRNHTGVGDLPGSVSHREDGGRFYSPASPDMALPDTLIGSGRAN